MTQIAHIQPASFGDLPNPRAGALAGMVAGPLFLLVVVILTLAELDYMHDLGWAFTKDDDVPYPSGLALGDLGFVQVLNFALAGALLVRFAAALRPALRDRRSGRVASVLIGLTGAALLVSAFPTDHGAVDGNPDTWHGVIHDVGFVLLVLLSVTAPIAAGFAVRRREGWSDLAPFMFAVPPVSILLFAGVPLLGDAAFLGYIAVLFGWIALLAARLLRRQTQSP